MWSFGWNRPVRVVYKLISDSGFGDILISISCGLPFFELVSIPWMSCDFLWLSHFSESFGLFDFCVVDSDWFPRNITGTGRKPLLNKKYTKCVNDRHKNKADEYVHDNLSSFGASRCEGINATHKNSILIVALSIDVEVLRIALLTWSLGVTIHAPGNGRWTGLTIGVWHDKIVSIKVVPGGTLSTGQVVVTALAAGEGDVAKNAVLQCLVRIVNVKVVTRIASCAITGWWASLTSSAASLAVEVHVCRVV